MSKNPSALVMALAISLWLSGCGTVSVYQKPVSNYQTAVTAANDSIRSYLLGVNQLIAEANLYDKVGLGKPWGSEDLHAGIPQEEIQVRLRALSTISSYANALGAVANSNDVEQLGQAAKTLGDDVSGLSKTIEGLAAMRTSAPTQCVSAEAAKLDLGVPVTTLVKLLGTAVIEHKQKAAIESAILSGAKPMNQLVDLLKADLRALSFVDQSSYDAMQRGLLKLYGDARAKTDAAGLISLIDQFAQKNDSIQTLRALQADALLSDMQNAQAALVTFAKSNKKPKDLSDLAAQIDVFTAHAKLFGDAIASTQSAAKTTK